MKKGFLLSLIVGVMLSLSSASAQPLSPDRISPNQTTPHGTSVRNGTRVFSATAHYDLLMVAGKSGDLDGDGDVDNDDLNLLLADLNTLVSDSACGAPCDLNVDEIINALDARILVTLCARPACATE